jgi:hypothetical protein
MAGGTLFAAGVICIPLRRIATWYNNKQQNSNDAGVVDASEKPPLMLNVVEQGKSTAVEL